MTAWSTGEVAGLFGLRPARVRAMARAGILCPSRGPRHAYRFGFQDLVLLRAARALVQSPMPERRVGRTLRRLVRQLPPGRLPCEVRLHADGGRIVARDGDLTWLPDSGQVVFDFSPSGPVPVTALPPPARAGGAFQTGAALEAAGDTDGAIAAYRLALQEEPTRAEAHARIARLYQRTGHKLAAMVHFKRYRELLPGEWGPEGF